MRSADAVWRWCWCAVVVSAGPQLWGADPTPALQHFEESIRPLLIDRCLKCHSGDDPKGGLRLDAAAGVRAGGESGAVISKERPQESLLLQAVRQENGLKMPPDGRLTDAQIQALAKWIEAGAPFPAGTASISPNRSATPRSPDDAVLAADLQLWLRADIAGLRDDRPVFLWPDASGQGRDLAATEGSRAEGRGQPATFVSRSRVHGFPAVRFSAETGLASSPARAPELQGDAEFSLIVVGAFEPNPSSEIDLLIGFGNVAWPSPPKQPHGVALGLGYRDDQLTLAGGWGHDATLGAGSFRPFYRQPLILSVVKRAGPFAATVEFTVNGKRLQAAMSGAAEPLDLHHRSDFGFFMGRAMDWLGGVTGDVAEIAVFRRALAAEDRKSLEAHFSAKFRIPLDEAQPPVVATDQPHWSFQPVSAVEPPEGRPEWSTHPIDRFIATKQAAMNMQSVADADPRTLVRRLSFDLHGLPPNPGDVAAFLANPTDDEWRALIDRLLDSPRYGERWGRHWLDVARYADTAGDNADYPLPEARLYRDYVIDAFQRDMPYDQFLREQLAGDLLAAEQPGERDNEQVIATTFLALSRRYATGPYEFWHLTLEDTIDTVGQAMMGLTLRCARCHDHKFDPITARDYYSLYGIFESTQYPWAGAEEFASKQTQRQHFIPLVSAAEAASQGAVYQTRLAELKAAVTQEEKEGPHALKVAELTPRIELLKKQVARQNGAGDLAAQLAVLELELKETQKALQKRLDELRTEERRWYKRGVHPDVPVAYAVREGIVRPAVVQLRGEPQRPGGVVQRGAIARLTSVVPLEIPADQSGRKQLAAWLTDPRHPLTARVMVNRVWQQHFGQGLVTTPSNFGTRGSPPTHPELLDWLAGEFVRSGWSIKAMHRLMLTSRTWRLSSAANAENAAVDPDNQLYWRALRRRLDAESIRDALLSTSGRLDLSRPGEHPFPPVHHWGYTQHTPFKDLYPSTHRSVYLMTPRLQRHPFLALFDGPDTNTTTDKRTSATVPLQALYLMNSPEVRTEAAAFAERIQASAMSDEDRLQFAIQTALSRPATDAEVNRGVAFLAEYRRQQVSDEDAWTSYSRALITSNEFFFLD